MISANKKLFSKYYVYSHFPSLVNSLMQIKKSSRDIGSRTLQNSVYEANITLISKPDRCCKK